MSSVSVSSISSTGISAILVPSQNHLMKLVLPNICFFSYHWLSLATINLVGDSREFKV